MSHTNLIQGFARSMLIMRTTPLEVFDAAATAAYRCRWTVAGEYEDAATRVRPGLLPSANPLHHGLTHRSPYALTVDLPGVESACIHREFAQLLGERDPAADVFVLYEFDHYTLITHGDDLIYAAERVRYNSFNQWTVRQPVTVRFLPVMGTPDSDHVSGMTFPDAAQAENALTRSLSSRWCAIAEGETWCSLWLKFPDDNRIVWLSNDSRLIPREELDALSHAQDRVDELTEHRWMSDENPLGPPEGWTELVDR